MNKKFEWDKYILLIIFVSQFFTFCSSQENSLAQNLNYNEAKVVIHQNKVNFIYKISLSSSTKILLKELLKKELN